MYLTFSASWVMSQLIFLEADTFITPSHELFIIISNIDNFGCCNFDLEFGKKVRQDWWYKGSLARQLIMRFLSPCNIHEFYPPGLCPKCFVWWHEQQGGDTGRASHHSPFTDITKSDLGPVHACPSASQHQSNSF